MSVDRMCQFGRWWKGEERLMEEGEGCFFESSYKATSCSWTQSVDLSGLVSMLWSCHLNFFHGIWLWRPLNKKYFEKASSCL